MRKYHKHAWLLKEDIKELQRIKKKHRFKNLAQALHQVLLDYREDYIDRLKSDKRSLKRDVNRLEKENRDLKEKNEELIKENAELEGYKSAWLLRWAKTRDAKLKDEPKIEDVMAKFKGPLTASGKAYEEYLLKQAKRFVTGEELMFCKIDNQSLKLLELPCVTHGIDCADCEKKERIKEMVKVYREGHLEWKRGDVSGKGLISKVDSVAKAIQMNIEQLQVDYDRLSGKGTATYIEG